MGLEMRKSGQVTLFIIIAILLVVGIIGAIYFMRVGEIEPPVIDSSNPVGSIEKCSTDAVEEAIGMLLPHGGYIETKEPYVFYRESNVSYLCYTSNTLTGAGSNLVGADTNEGICENLEPMLIERVEEEIKSYALPIIENCFAGLKNELKNNDYEEGPINLDIDIQKSRVMIIIDKRISFEVGGVKNTFNNFNSDLSSPLYDFFRISNDIINEEVLCDCGSETCNADVVGISRAERAIEVERFVTGRNEKIYTLKDIFSGKEFMFGVRNCVRLPA